MQVSEKKSLTVGEIQTWLIDYMANQLSISPNQIDIEKNFNTYNIDSAVLIGMTGELETLLGYILDPTLVYDYPSIALLSEQLGTGTNTSWKKNLHREI
jgi:acyl carrier protein